MFLSATPSRQGACREESLVTVTEWTDGEIDKHKGMWHSLRPKESKSWASPSPHCGEMRRFWKGCGIHVSKQTLPQIASVISPSPPDIQTEARKRRTGSPSNGIHWQGWSLWPTFDIWGSLCFAEHVCYWTSVCPSHPLSTSLPFPSSISFSSLISFYPFFFFLQEDFAFKKNSNFLTAEAEKEKKEFTCVWSTWANREDERELRGRWGAVGGWCSLESWEGMGVDGRNELWGQEPGIALSGPPSSRGLPWPRGRLQLQMASRRGHSPQLHFPQSPPCPLPPAKPDPLLFTSENHPDLSLCSRYFWNVLFAPSPPFFCLFVLDSVLITLYSLGSLILSCYNFLRQVSALSPFYRQDDTTQKG